MRIQRFLFFLLCPILYFPLLFFWLTLAPFLLVKMNAHKLAEERLPLYKGLALIFGPILIPFTVLGMLGLLSTVVLAISGRRRPPTYFRGSKAWLDILLLLLGIIILPISILVAFVVSIINFYTISKRCWEILVR